jgi:hypothetical protein
VKKVFHVVSSAFLLMSSATLLAEPRGQLLNGDGECYVHEYSDGEIVSLNVAPFADLRIEMPSSVYLVILGGGRLWHSSYSKQTLLPHVWVKSKTTDSYEGQTTSMTVLDDQMHAYDIVLNRVKNPGYTCAKIVASRDSEVMERLANWKSKQSLQAELSNRKVANAQLDMEKRVEAIKEHATEVIKSQKAKYYTQYTWRQKGGVFSSGQASLIRSVMDDGIFTTITLNDNKQGVLSVFGIYGGKEHQVEMTYDEQLMQYTLTGVYNSIKLRFDDFVIDVDRIEQE